MTFKPLLIVALSATVGLVTSPASAEFKFENRYGGTTLLYGQFDPAYLSFDDGGTTTGTLVDNGNSNSRVGLWYRQAMGESQFSFNLETALGFRQSFGVSQNFEPDAWDWQRTSIRKVDFALKTASAGTFSLGQGSMASDGVVHSDLSGTTLVTYSSIPDTAGAFFFRTTAGVLSTRPVVSAFSDFDGGRRLRIRYDSPAWNGFVVSASYGEEVLTKFIDDKFYDITLRYAREVGTVRMVGALGYTQRKLVNGTKIDSTIGSFSLLHDSGFNLTLAGGSRRNAGRNGYAKLGYRADWFAVGTTAMSIDYYKGSDKLVQGSKSNAVGFGIVQSFDDANVEAYLGYRVYELSEPGTTYQDASSILVGARWKF